MQGQSCLSQCLSQLEHKMQCESQYTSVQLCSRCSIFEEMMYQPRLIFKFSQIENLQKNVDWSISQVSHVQLMSWPLFYEVFTSERPRSVVAKRSFILFFLILAAYFTVTEVVSGKICNGYVNQSFHRYFTVHQYWSHCNLYVCRPKSKTVGLGQNRQINLFCLMSVLCTVHTTSTTCTAAGDIATLLLLICNVTSTTVTSATDSAAAKSKRSTCSSC